jgi:uncharacterized damage-inducible protein DinB
LDIKMIVDAFKYKQWADQRMVDAVNKIDGAKFPSAVAFVRQQLNHMVRVEELFRARLADGPVPHLSTNTDIVPELDALIQRINVSNQWYSSYSAGLEDCHRQKTVVFEFVDGQSGNMTRAEILFHIINHGTYHRGVIAHCLDLTGVPHPADTFTVYIHSVEPQRRGAGA